MMLTEPAEKIYWTKSRQWMFIFLVELARDFSSYFSVDLNVCGSWKNMKTFINVWDHDHINKAAVSWANNNSYPIWRWRRKMYKNTLNVLSHSKNGQNTASCFLNKRSVEWATSYTPHKCRYLLCVREQSQFILRLLHLCKHRQRNSK